MGRRRPHLSELPCGPVKQLRRSSFYHNPFFLGLLFLLLPSPSFCVCVGGGGGEVGGGGGRFRLAKSADRYTIVDHLVHFSTLIEQFESILF